MKLSKKILAAFSVAAMLAVGLSFTACGEDDDNDDGMITKIDSKTFVIDSTKDSIDDVEGTASDDGKANEAKRAYITTTFKHRGELVRFTFDKPKDTNEGGVLGFMWDLSSVKEKGDTTSTRDFWVLGLSLGYTTNKVSAYVSKYYNVKDITARNFGATGEGNSGTTVLTTDADGKINSGNPYELIVKNLSTSDHYDIVDTSTLSDDEKLVIWADIYPTLTDGNTHELGKEDSTSKFSGGWTIDLYKADEEGTDLTKLTQIKVGNDTATIDIGSDKTGYVAATETTGTKLPQGYLAVYANVYANKELHGGWYLDKDYYADEIVEE